MSTPHDIEKGTPPSDSDALPQEVPEAELRRHLSAISVEGAGAAAAAAGFSKTETTEANAVGWDGPDDPQNPLNWPAKKKWANIFALSFMTILT